MELLGWKNNRDVYSLMQSASYLVLPSTWYEGFPRTIAEAYACGLPVIGTRLGPMPEIIEHGVTGLLFEPGSAQDLAEKMLWAEAHPEEMAKMGQRAREVHAEKYTSETNYRQLISIYSKVIRERKQGVSGFSGR
jgi:glycosyltransferase involved in cell wall biosynthesis